MRQLVAHMIRRVLWVIPTAVAVSLGTFALLSFLPPPESDDSGGRLAPRERFLSFPVF